MTGKLQVPNTNLVNAVTQQAFMKDVLQGLSKTHKTLPSKYFYDELGGELFNLITRHPDYYLTQCELEIIRARRQEISHYFRQEAINLIELGVGEGIKTRLLMEQFMADGINFTYCPIDISQKYLNHLLASLQEELPQVNTLGVHAEYLQGIQWILQHSTKRNVLLFLGSSIGNFDEFSATDFLSALQAALHPGDYVLIGFDLVKDVSTLMKAYNDGEGLTRDFNLNLLRRMNQELGAHFNGEDFYHFERYNPTTTAMESYLVSRKSQWVSIDVLKKAFYFNPLEPIHVESSHKYRLPQVTQLAQRTQFKIEQHFLDSRRYFLDSLWRV